MYQISMLRLSLCQKKDKSHHMTINRDIAMWRDLLMIVLVSGGKYSVRTQTSTETIGHNCQQSTSLIPSEHRWLGEGFARDLRHELGCHSVQTT